ncbi:MAG: cytochrome C oxidase subunit IV family protein [Planctomycetota bacterium]|nr:cytochrome C oxidase subunit IV family protein [Planctomycetota bacterium]MDA1113958.1 cytochrome C oxidase subunit IV family protein [Planctomycetota bacterium]
MNARSINTTWIVLLALTTASYFFAEADNATPWILPLLGIAFLKLGLIQAVFMELFGCRPMFLRIALALDLLIVGLISVPFLI